MNQADYIIDKFGGITAMAAKLGHRNPSTVQGWKKRGTIPPGRYVEILDAAHTHNINFKPDDFVRHLKVIGIEEPSVQPDAPHTDEPVEHDDGEAALVSQGELKLQAAE